MVSITFLTYTVPSMSWVRDMKDKAGDSSGRSAQAAIVRLRRFQINGRNLNMVFGLSFFMRSELPLQRR